MGNDLIKSNPKTIADLDIKWKFTNNPYLSFTPFLIDFNKLNPGLDHNFIIPKLYKFKLFAKYSFKIDAKKSVEFSEQCYQLRKFPYSVRTLLYVIDMKVRLYLRYYKYIQELKLHSFYKLSNNSFDILIKSEDDLF